MKSLDITEVNVCVRISLEVNAEFWNLAIKRPNAAAIHARMEIVIPFECVENTTVESERPDLDKHTIQNLLKGSIIIRIFDCRLRYLLLGLRLSQVNNVYSQDRDDM